MEFWDVYSENYINRIAPVAYARCGTQCWATL